MSFKLNSNIGKCDGVGVKSTDFPLFCFAHKSKFPQYISLMTQWMNVCFTCNVGIHKKSLQQWFSNLTLALHLKHLGSFHTRPIYTKELESETQASGFFLFFFKGFSEVSGYAAEVEKHYCKVLQNCVLQIQKSVCFPFPLTPSHPWSLTPPQTSTALHRTSSVLILFSPLHHSPSEDGRLGGTRLTSSGKNK